MSPRLRFMRDLTATVLASVAYRVFLALVAPAPLPRW